MRSVYLNLQNGMRIQDSLEVSKNVVKNNVMLSVIETSINNIFIGQSWIDPFEKTRLSSPMTTEMLDLRRNVGNIAVYPPDDSPAHPVSGMERKSDNWWWYPPVPENT